MPDNPPSLSVIILTYNEELNIAQAIHSVSGWAKQIYVVDSFSSDRTVEICETLGAVVTQRKFTDYASQRNFAIESLPAGTEWSLFLDADEWVPPQLRTEISEVIASDPAENGFYLSRRFLWMGRWIRRGYYPTWILRLFRNGKAVCEARSVNEHLLVEGKKVGYLKNDFVHEDRSSILKWVEKHNRYAWREAYELLRGVSSDQLDARLDGTPAERIRWVRSNIWDKMPLLVRPFMLFIYRYVLRGGFLDGKQAFIYHFLHALWYRMLIDVHYLELRNQAEDERKLK